MTYRDDHTALAARKSALETELRARQRELDDASRMVDELEHRVRLPVLDNIKIAAPCSADWAAMTGDERVRACADCNKNVYNLTEMTRQEAEALILAKEGRLCVRYFQRKDGTILLKDCVIGVRRRRRRGYVAAGIAASLAAGLFGALHNSDESCDHNGMVQGAVALPIPEGHDVVGRFSTPPPPVTPAPSDDDAIPSEPPPTTVTTPTAPTVTPPHVGHKMGLMSPTPAPKPAGRHGRKPASADDDDGDYMTGKVSPHHADEDQADEANSE